jgi:hypothetical protein
MLFTYVHPSRSPLYVAAVNAIGNEAVTELASALHVNKSLTNLNLWSESGETTGVGRSP